MFIKKHGLNLVVIFLGSLLSVVPFFMMGTLYAGSDMGYHLNRVYDIYMNLKNENIFPYISTFGLNHLGAPTDMVYGFLPCYFLAVPMLFIHNPIYAIYVGFELIFLLMMLIAYYSGILYWKNNRKALLFAFLYSFSAYLFDLAFGSFGLGQFFAAAFIPMLAYGTYNLFFEGGNYWYLAVLGISGITYSHLISILMNLTLAIVIVLLSFLFNGKRNWLKIGEAVVSACLTTSFYWVNFYTVITSGISATKKDRFILGDDPLVMFDNVLTNKQSIGIIFLIIMILGLLRWRSLDSKTHASFYIIIMYTVFISSLFNIGWVVISKTPLVQIQWPGRFIVIINFFVAIFDTETISVYLNLINAQKLRKVVYIIVLSMGLFLFWSNCITFFNINKNEAEINYWPTTNHPLPFQNYQIKNATAFYQIVGENYSGVGSSDYWPKESLGYSGELISGVMRANGKKISYKRVSKPNGIKYEIISKEVKGGIDLPFLSYGDNYRVLINGHNVRSFKGKRGTICAQSKQEIKSVTIKYSPGLSNKLLGWVSLIAVISLIVCLFKDFLTHRKVNVDTY